MVSIFLISTPRNIAYIITSDPETGQSESEKASVVESEDITFTFRINSGNIKSSANQRGDQPYTGQETLLRHHIPLGGEILRTEPAIVFTF